ncbi:hypothetical protein [Micromonospora sp. NPDC050495]|uniref:hypothetical protein n=1 Tax=Micromonospora sp. NPDC050495 TaxID=3154936 RepID=UPI00340C7C0E
MPETRDPSAGAAEPAEPAEPIGAAEPPGAAEPVGAVEPAEPAGAAGAAEPAEPAGAAEPAGPAPDAGPGPGPCRPGRLRTLLRRLAPVGPPAGRWFAGVAAAVVTAVVTAWLLASGLAPPPPESHGLPFTIAVRTSHDSSLGWLIDAPVAKIPARPGWAEDWSSWAREAAGVPAFGSEVYFTVQGISEAQVTLTDLRVRVLARRPPVPGVLIGLGGGGSGAYRWVDADLDKQPPLLTSGRFEEGEQHVPEHERKEIRFPYRVSVSDAETFVVVGHTAACDCDWTIEVDWASQGRTGTVTVDDAGRPFRVTGTGGAHTECWMGPDDTEQCRPR